MNRFNLPTLLAVSAAALVAACSPSVSDLGGATPPDKTATANNPPPPAIADDTGVTSERLDYFEMLPKGGTQLAALCARGNQDRVSKFLCASPTPSIAKLDDLLTGLKLKDPANLANMQFAITGHSSSLVMRRTTPLNPRAVILTPAGTADYTALGFVRGDHLAEIAAFDPIKQDINFFLVKYEKPCDPDCPNSERYSPETETGWQNVTVYGDQDLKNTPLDCLQCHQPGGISAKRILRMQERVTPWTHWFRNNRPSVALLNEFQAAHPNEDYAGIPANLITNSDPAKLEKLVEGAGFTLQPNEFKTALIEQEGRGPTWLALYANAMAGGAISVPFYMIDPADPAKLAAAATAYKAVIAGTSTPDTMPDMTDLFPDVELGDLGFRAGDGATTGAMVVQHRCGTCHNGTFPGVTRNNFVVADFPNNLPAHMRDKILQRISLSKTSRLRMPPTMFSDLSDTQIELIRADLAN